MPTIETLERREAQHEGTAHHYGALIAALGDGRDWAYTGVVEDAGRASAKCACGHPIRYCYVIEHVDGKRTAQLGSECINHFEDANPELHAALMAAQQRLREELAAAKRQAKLARDLEEVQAAEATWQEAVARANRFLDQGREHDRYTPGALYHLANRTLYLHGPRQYKTPNGYLGWYAKATAEITRVLDATPCVTQWDRKPPRRW